MGEIRESAVLTELGKRLVSGSLSDAAIQRATEDTPTFPILPWVNVVKIGGKASWTAGGALCSRLWTKSSPTFIVIK